MRSDSLKRCVQTNADSETKSAKKALEINGDDFLADSVDINVDSETSPTFNEACETISIVEDPGPSEGDDDDDITTARALNHSPPSPSPSPSSSEEEECFQLGGNETDDTSLCSTDSLLISDEDEDEDEDEEDKNNAHEPDPQTPKSPITSPPKVTFRSTLAEHKGLRIEIEPRTSSGSFAPATERASSGYRIPSHVFARAKSGAPQAEWSTASNESLFSIHMGNASFNTDQYFYYGGKSGELGMSGPFLDFTGTNKLPDGDFRATEAKAAETMREVIRESAGNNANEESPKRAALASPSISRDGTSSFAFPVLGGGGDKIRSEDRAQKGTVGDTHASANDSAKTGQTVSRIRWNSCFPCCRPSCY